MGRVWLNLYGWQTFRYDQRKGKTFALGYQLGCPEMNFEHVFFYCNSIWVHQIKFLLALIIKDQFRMNSKICTVSIQAHNKYVSKKVSKYIQTAQRKSS